MSRSTSFVGVHTRAKQAVGMALMAGAASLALAPSIAFAHDDTGAAIEAAPSDGASVGELRITGSRKGEPDSPKYTAPVLDTPQTITVVSKAVIAAQDLMTLRDILSTVPGITFGAGEGGGGYGDSINLRGYAASSDITVDGVRDSAQYTRSDPFNMEQLEVTNGANGVYSGAGSVGGSMPIRPSATASPYA
jgi:catecholate siderophore receptor